MLKARTLEGLLEMRLDRAQLILLVVGHWALWEPMQTPAALLASISRRQIKCVSCGEIKQVDLLELL